MRLLILTFAFSVVFVFSTLAHQRQDDASKPEATEPSANHEGPAKAAEDGPGDNKGPLERAGAELDKALSRTIEALSNSALEFRVKNHLHSHDVKKWRELIITAKEGEVTVEGEVDDEAMATKVLDIVKSTSGVKSVLSKLKIKSLSEASIT